MLVNPTMQQILTILLVIGLSTVDYASAADTPDSYAVTRVKAAVNHWRDQTSKVRAKMKVHRPDWEREMELESLTQGTDHSLVRFLAPPRDAGSASLTLGNEMWSYSPKINRVIKIPPSMMTQSWMGSDFSYNDLARSDDIIDYYEHKLVGKSDCLGVAAEDFELTPKPDAPVVWGKETLKVRKDNIICQHEFFDQAMQMIKVLNAKSVGQLGGKIFPLVMRMQKIENPEEWTEIVHETAEFNIKVDQNAFSIAALSK